MPQDSTAPEIVHRQAIGRRVRERRLWLNLSQEGLGELVGVDRRTISGWEHAMSDPTLSDLIRLADALDVPLAELVAE